MNYAGHPAPRARAQYPLGVDHRPVFAQILVCYDLKNVHVRIDSASACKVTN